MSTSPRFEIEPELPNEPERKGCWRSCLVGCLIALVVLVVVGVIAGFWIKNNWRDWATSFGSDALKQGIEQSDLDPQEKIEINVQVDRVAKDFREGRLSDAQMQKIIKKLFDSPLMTSLMASAAEKKYVDGSGLSDEEKVEARQTLRRFFRGSIDGKIDQDAVDAAMGHVADRQPDQSWKLRDKVTDLELRAFLEKAKSEADEVAIPEVPEDIDPSDELKRIIDEATGAADKADAPDQAGEPDDADGVDNAEEPKP